MKKLGSHSVPVRALATAFVGCALGLAVSTRANSAAPQAAQEVFESHEVVLGATERQTVVTGSLLGGTMADLAVAYVDENGGRRLEIYAFGDDGWAPALDAALSADVLFVDVANIGGRDRLVTYEPGLLNWFDPELMGERALVAVTSSFAPPRTDEIPHVDISHDVNHDGRDDLVVPDVDGFHILLQTSDGTFAEAVTIGPPTDLSGIYGPDGNRYDPWGESRVHEIDYDGDGRDDLVFWREDHFVVHRQDERGRFAAEAGSFTTDVAFDSDDFLSLATGKMQGTVLNTMTDVNGDGVADLVVFSLEGRDLSTKRSFYQVHFGTRADGGTVFDPEAGATFQSDGRIQLGMDRYTVDDDGPIVLMFTTIDVGYLRDSLWKRIKGSMGDDVWLELEFHRLENGRYSGEANAMYRIALDAVPSHREPGWVPLDIVLRGPTHVRRRTQEEWPRAFNRTLLMGDVTGDGRLDLLIEREFRDLHLSAGVAGADLFAPRPEPVAVVLHDQEYAWLADLNGDGKQDVLVHHPFTSRDVHGGPAQPAGAEPHRVTTLIAR